MSNVVIGAITAQPVLYPIATRVGAVKDDLEDLASRLADCLVARNCSTSKKMISSTRASSRRLVGRQMVEGIGQGQSRIKAFGGNRVHRNGSPNLSHLNSLRDYSTEINLR